MNNIKKINQKKIFILDKFFVSNEVYVKTKVLHYKGKYILLIYRSVIRSADIQSSDQNPDLNAIRIIIFLIE